MSTVRGGHGARRWVSAVVVAVSMVTGGVVGVAGPAGAEATPNLMIELASGPTHVGATGSVTGAGVSCDAASTSWGLCSFTVATGSLITLTATPAAGSLFVGWAGDCSGSGTCQVDMSMDAYVVANFELDAKQISVAKYDVPADYPFSGRIVSSPAGIDCTLAAGPSDSACSYAFVRGTEVTLTAIPADGSAFTGWDMGTYGEGACSGRNLTCVVDATMNGFITQIAGFGDPRPTLTIGGGSGPVGTGIVVSTPAGLACGTAASNCEAHFDVGTTVTLTAAPGLGWRFAAWAGSCSGTALTCDVTLAEAGVSYDVAATFDRPLTVIRFGSGSGTVTSDTGDIDCGSTCSAPPDDGLVTLTATAAPGSTFIGWGAGCSGTGTCTAGYGQTIVAYFRGATTGRTALINGDSVVQDSDGISKEELIARSLGYNVTVVSDAQWSSKTAAQFGAYDLLIVGDTGGLTPSGIGSSAPTWGPVVLGTAGGRSVAGNRVVVGTDPADHTGDDGLRQTIVRRGIQFAGSNAGTTGMFLATGDGGEAVEPAVAALSTGTGTLTVDTNPPCGGSVSVIAAHPAFTDLTTAGLEGWGCSTHVSFPTYPSGWSALAVATDTATKPTCGVDPSTTLAACGQAYILVAGASIVVRSLVISTGPETGTAASGSDYTVTANVHGVGGTPVVAGQHVDFTVSGVNVGATGTCVPVTCASDADGNVTFTYRGNHGAGSDTVKASFVDGDGSLQSATSEVVWTPGPGPVLAVSSVSHVEGDSGRSLMHVHVTLSEPATSTVSAIAHVAPGTATTDDFSLPKDRTLVFRPGQVAKTLAIKVTPDTAVEGDETFSVELRSVVNAATEGAIAMETILDDDLGGGTRIAIDDALIREGDSKARSVHVMVSLSAPPTSIVSVPYTTVPGTASGAASSKASGDFRLRSGTLTFLPGQQVKTIAIALAPDLTVEGDEAFTIMVSGSPDITRAVGTVTIRDDD